MAEILISITIAMIVATAMVPLLGTKKIKFPHARIEHGIAVCYYNANNQLQYEYRETKRGGSSHNGAAEGDHCSLALPKSNYVEIIAVGPGGSSTSNDFTITQATGTNQQSGSIRIDGNFQTDINAASSKMSDLPDKIRATLNEWAQRSPNSIYANYTITSPLGAGGTGLCQPVYANMSCSAINPTTWNSRNARTNYPTDNYDTDCWWYQHGKGGDSGSGLKINNAAFPINGNTVIDVEESIYRSGISIKDTDNDVESSVFLSASGNGNNPQWNNTPGKGYFSDGASSSQSSSCSYTGNKNLCSSAISTGVNQGKTGGIEQAWSQKCLENPSPAKEGIVTYRGKDIGTNEWNANAPITWVYNTLAVRPSVISQRGEYGKEASQSFENLKGAIDLYPAPSGSRRASYARHNGATIISAGFGEDGHAINPNMNFDITEQIPSDIADIGKPDNENQFNYLSKVKGSGYNIPIRNCGNACPGFAGTGTYLFVKKTNQNNLNYLQITNRQGNVGSYVGGQAYTKYFSDGTTNYSALDTCPNGDIENNTNLPWASVCKGRIKNGMGGAVIVIW